MAFEIAKAWGPYSSLLPMEELLDCLQRPLKMLGDKPVGVLPSIVMGQKGPRVASVYFRTAGVLGEVSVGEAAFDFVPLLSVFNYRVELGSMTFVNSDAAEGSLPQLIDTASVRLTHVIHQFHTNLHYVGYERERWLSELEAFLPISVVAESWGGPPR